MKRIIILACIFFQAFSFGCNNTDADNNHKNEPRFYNPTIGEGPFSKVEIPAPIDEKIANQGALVFSNKCMSCHKTTSEKLIGPGLLGVTGRHSPEWILNYLTNTEAMQSKDDELKKMIAVYTIRMPGLQLSREEALAVFEYLRKNDIEHK